MLLLVSFSHKFQVLGQPLRLSRSRRREPMAVPHRLSERCLEKHHQAQQEEQIVRAARARCDLVAEAVQGMGHFAPGVREGH